MRSIFKLLHLQMLQGTRGWERTLFLFSQFSMWCYQSVV